MRASISSAQEATRKQNSTGIDYSKLESDDEDKKGVEVAALARRLAPMSVSNPARAYTSTTRTVDNNDDIASPTRQHVQQQQYISKMETFGRKYSSQHCSKGDSVYTHMNLLLDSLNLQGIRKMCPNYRSGINPNYFEEYFSNLPVSDITKTVACKIDLFQEYQSRRWSYLQHLTAYHQKAYEKYDVDSVEFWRRFQVREKPPVSIREWYFDDKRKLGDVMPSYFSAHGYLEGVSDVLSQSFSNTPVPPSQTLTFGTTHVAAGFVDLGQLLDSRFVEAKDESPLAYLHFCGYEASSFAVAKSLIIWEMLCTPGMEARWVVQVWFSTIWSKRATNAFLAATRRVAAMKSCHPSAVFNLVTHWSHSKGVGLKKQVQRRKSTRNESSDALFFARKEDRVEMIRYFLTGAFGLLGEAPCSGSVLMFDCPTAPTRHEAASVFETLTISDVMTSDLYNGSYFQTAEKVKEARVSRLLDHATSGRIKVKLEKAFLSPRSRVLQEIASLRPHSMSWSNILDYMAPDEFHALAKTCGANAVHSGYSMNWPSTIYGASLIDYPTTSLKIITDAEDATIKNLQKVCQSHKIFLTPIQHNPLNTTAGLLAKRCHSHWLEHFLGASGARLLEGGVLEGFNPLSRVSVVVSASWVYY